MQQLMNGKRGLILGLANDKSIAWGIARACAAQGAELAFTYPGPAQHKRIVPLARSIGADLILPCDVAREDDIDHLFDTLKREWGHIDFVVHAVSFSDKQELQGPYLDTSKDNFINSMVISTWSFTSILRRAKSIMAPGGACLTLTYYGAEKVLPHYNVMGIAKAALEASVKYLAADLGPSGIRVNAISAGTIKTLAASGISDFREILKWNEQNAPLRRTVDTGEVGNAALYLLSDLGSGVTGEIHHVDAGYNVIGMRAIDGAA